MNNRAWAKEKDEEKHIKINFNNNFDCLNFINKTSDTKLKKVPLLHSQQNGNNVVNKQPDKPLQDYMVQNKFQ